MGIVEIANPQGLLLITVMLIHKQREAESPGNILWLRLLGSLLALGRH